MLPSVYVSPLKLHSATEIDLHGVSGSALFRNQFVFLLLSHPVADSGGGGGGALGASAPPAESMVKNLNLLVPLNVW